MKIQKIIVLLILSVIISCTKSADELLELSENNLQNSKVDLAISDLEKLLKKHPDDSLASKAQYKLSSIYLNWKNDPDMYQCMVMWSENNEEGPCHSVDIRGSGNREILAIFLEYAVRHTIFFLFFFNIIFFIFFDIIQALLCLVVLKLYHTLLYLYQVLH